MGFVCCAFTSLCLFVVDCFVVCFYDLGIWLFCCCVCCFDLDLITFVFYLCLLVVWL